MTLNELILRVPLDLFDCQLMVQLPHPDRHSETDEWKVYSVAIDQRNTETPTIILDITDR